MNAALSFEHPVRVPALHDEGRRRDTGLLTFLNLVELDLEALRLRPPRVHTQEHLRPVLRVRSSRARVDLTDRVTLVVLAAEQCAELQAVEVANQSTDALGDLRLEGRVVFVPRELVQGLDVRKSPIELVDQLDVLAHARHLGRHLARPIGVAPEIGRARLLFEIREPGARLADAQVLVRLGDSTREISDLLREITHATSTPVAELVLLAAA